MRQRVVTYRQAYGACAIELCAACIERDDHDCGALGEVQHGEHDGSCDGRRHRQPMRTDVERDAAECRRERLQSVWDA
jgi:hypothetical protein